MPVDIKKVLAEKRPEIDGKIEEYIPRKLTKENVTACCGVARYAYDVDTMTASVNEPIWNLLDRGGKRWRPALMLICHEAFGGDAKKIMNFTVIPEVVHNGCVTEDTLIMTAAGIPKKIVDLKEGELVLSLDSTGKIVKKPILKKHDNGTKPIFSIRTNNREIKVTANHPFLVARKIQPIRMRITEYGKQQLVVKLGELNKTISEFVDGFHPMLSETAFSSKHLKNSLYRYGSCLVPKEIACIISDKVGLEHEKCWQSVQCVFAKADIEFKWVQANELKAGDLLVVSREIAQLNGVLPVLPPVKQSSKDRLKIPAEFTVEMAQLAGFLLGDGSIDYGRVTLCLPQDQPGHREYLELVTRMFNAQPSVSRNTITCCSKALSTIFQNLGLAKHALQKSIPEWVYLLPREHKLAFIRGYLDSDGTVNKEGYPRFECASKELIVGLKALLDSLGFVTSNVTSREVDNTHFSRPVSKPSTRLYCVQVSSKEKALTEIGTEISIYRERLCRKTARQVAMRYEEEIPSIPKWFSKQLGFSKIASIVPAGEQHTYDATIEDTHNYIANGIIAHNTLLVDDVEDDSALRRGKPCTHKIYGVDVAINAGNAMYFLPLLVLKNNKHRFSKDVIIRAYEVYSQEMINVSYGQGMDIWWHKGKKEDITESEYLQMCAYKTGTLARMAAKLGALLAEASEKEVELVGKFAESIGIAFQIQDDVLNLVGEEFAKGKGVGEDIHEGKRSLIVIHSLANLSKKDALRLREILAMHTDNQKIINEAISILKKANSIEYARQRAREIVKVAWKDLAPALKESQAKETLHAFANYLVERKI